ncbi:phosphotransferase [Streptomyces sp. B5E4]|uniref:phosphotransferase n=1 Tax=Streptomyces sp. B5E4 TaxID=3153568 RepID=UPI00325CF569
MEPRDLRRAVEAGRATAAELGLQVDDVIVVHDSDRVVLRLVPCEVLARVAPSEQLADSEFEVEVARRLTDVDAPVAELEPRVDPRVYVRDAFAISLWSYYEPVGPEIAPADYADVLMRHHAALHQIDLGAPHFTDRVAGALREVNDRERSPELSDADREFLSTTLSGLTAAISIGSGGDQLLHGEPHPGNLLNTRRGPLFVDLATCCRGPVEFDLAHAPEDVGRHYAGADHDLIHQCRALGWAIFSAWRWRRDDHMPDRAHRRVEGLKRVHAALDRCGLDRTRDRGRSRTGERGVRPSG